MAKYLISSPAFVNGVHLGSQATVANKQVIEVADDVEPSVTWEPADEAGLKALNKAIDMLVEKRTMGLDPKRDDFQIKSIEKSTRDSFKKVLAKEPPEAKPQPREVTTNQEIAADKGKIVGRHSDKSPA